MKEQEKLLEIINQIEIPKRGRTYLEEIKVAHKEVVMADILAHFFNPKPKKEHFLNDIFIKALLQTEAQSLKAKGTTAVIHKELDKITNSCFLDAQVDVEETTEKKNRLDIVITSIKADTVIGVEFKINHELNNPLDDYQNLIEGNKYNKYSNKIYLVLTPYWKEPIGEAKDNSVFVQVMLSHFIKKIEGEVRTRKIFANRKSSPEYYYYIDFINTIKNKGAKVQVVKDYRDLTKEGETKKLQKEELYQLENNKEALKKSDVLKRVKTFYESKIKALKKELEKDKELSISGTELLNQNKDKVVQVLQFKKNKQTFKVRLSCKGWELEKWSGIKKCETKSVTTDVFSSISSIKSKI